MGANSFHLEYTPFQKGGKSILTISPDSVSFNYENMPIQIYSKTCVRQAPLKLTLVVDVKSWLSYKGTCHVILLAKLHDMYRYKTDNFFHINRYFKSVSKMALLHRFYCTENFTTKKWKFTYDKFWYVSSFCSKHRLWVLVRTASVMRF